jgi:NADPH-dependent 2,4-dienoyl-CoA reductase/sulfur reductase-like enzyme/rhodanese-related sulfurtransferase
VSRRILIVGGVAGGASAAARARRLNEDAEIIIFERGGYVSFANCGLPYYVGRIITDRRKLLLQTPEMFLQRFRVDVRLRHEVIRIDRDQKRIEVRNLDTGETAGHPYDKLILCPGADPFVPPIENADAPNVFSLRSVEDTDTIYAYLDAHGVSSVTIVGAGFIGLEVADALTHRGIHAEVVEMLNQVLAPLDADMACLVEQHVREKGVGLHLGNALDTLITRDGLVKQVGLKDGTVIDTEMVLMSIGVRPNSRLAADAGLELGERGGIRVNEHLQTSDPDIFAAGDAVEIRHGVTGKPSLIPLAGPANKHGRLIGEMAATDRLANAANVVGTAIVKVFDLAVATTGINVGFAERSGIEAAHAIVRRPNHVTYYPGATPMLVKIVYAPSDGRLLGAQIVGRDGVDRRIDVIATAIHFGGTIDDLADLDLAYAPQFGAAKDPLNIAAFVAQNQQNGLVRHADPSDIDRLVGAGYQLVDLRTPREFAAGTVPGSVNIPLDELRDRASEISADQPVLVFCMVGQRGYVGARILQNLGRDDVINLAGGYAWYAEQQR